MEVQKFGVVCSRATTAERAEAWSRLMESTESDSVALQEAWNWLADVVLDRERRGAPTTIAHVTHVRSNHHHSFHSGEWAQILRIVVPDLENGLTTTCYAVEFENGEQDLWPVLDRDARYEFKCD